MMSAIAQAAVETAAGRLEGAVEDGLCVFRGVPFAAPPVGALRFRAPQPLEPWLGVRAAKEFGPICLQMPSPVLDILPPPETLQPQSEDCLYLNIWTPGLDDAKRPVMVWIHGGGFTFGAGSEPLYDGANLARRGGVVVVTINYRLGAFGFLNDPALAEINLGIRDQIAALRWVRENIAQFGGDPDNTTIFGESSGGHSVTTLLAAAPAAGLFQKAIAQSPDPHSERHVPAAAAFVARIYRALGVDQSDLEALRVIPAADLHAAQSAVEAERMESLGIDLLGELIWTPIPDGEVLLELPIDMVAAGKAAGAALMIGTTDEEFKLFSSFLPAGDVDEASAVRRLDAAHGDGRRVYDVYRAARTARSEAAGPQDILDAALADGWVALPAQRLAEAHADAGGRTFSYVFDWKSPLLDGALGACHAIDLPFTFGTQALAAEFVGSGPAVDALADCVMDCWIAFARTGDPSTAQVNWPAYDSAARAQLVFGEHVRVEHNWRGQERAVWDGVV